MSKEELIKSFDYKRLSKSPSKFDIQKMDWFAKKYMKNQCNEILKKKLLFSKNQDENWKNIFLNTYKENSKNILELQSNIEKYEVEQIVGNYLPNEVTDTFKEILLSLEFNINNIQSAIDKTKLKCNVSGKNLFTPIRRMTTGLDYGPELAKEIFLFG